MAQRRERAAWEGGTVAEKARSSIHTIHLKPLLHDCGGAGSRYGRGPSQIKVGQRFSYTQSGCDNFVQIMLSRFDIYGCLTARESFSGKIILIICISKTDGSRLLK